MKDAQHPTEGSEALEPKFAGVPRQRDRLSKSARERHRGLVYPGACPHLDAGICNVKTIAAVSSATKGDRPT